MAARIGNVLLIKCPHCLGRAKVRSSTDVLTTYKELYLQCQELACGHTWKAELAFVHTICPSATPRPGLNLPTSDANAGGRLAKAAARIEVALPIPANDQPAAAPGVPPAAANDDDVASEAM